MTVSSNANKSGPYTANGSTTVFARGFLVLDADHLKVFQTTDGNDVEITSGITKDGIGTAAGNVTFDVAPADGTLITLIRDVPLLQSTDYPTQSKVSPEQVEDDFDRVVMMLQDIYERVARSFVLPVSTGLSDLAIPQPVAGQILFGRDDETGWENREPSTFSSGFLSVPDGMQVAKSGLNALLAIFRASLPVTGSRGLAIYGPDEDSASAPFHISTANSIAFDIDAVTALLIDSDGEAEFTESLKAPAFIGKYNIKYHGAVGDGATNDSPAIDAAFDYALASGGPVEAPAGQFLMNDAVSKTPTGAARKTGLIGAGQGSTEFIIPSTNTTGGFLLNVSGTADRSDQATFRDFSMETRAKGGVGLRFVQSRGGVQDLSSVTCQDVQLWTDMTGDNYFATAFDFDGAWRPIIRGIKWSGPVNGYTHADSDPAYSCNIALDLANCYDPMVSDCEFKGAKAGVSWTDTGGGNEAEAIRIDRSVMNQVNYGLYILKTTREPLVMVTNTHCNYKIAGIELDGAKSVQIALCNFYNEDLGNIFTGIPTDIRLTNASEAIIMGNIHHFIGHSDRVGVFVNDNGEAGAGHNNMISNNIFNATMDEAIHIEAGADNNTGSGNMYTGTIATNVVDGGAGNTVT